VKYALFHGSQNNYRSVELHVADELADMVDVFSEVDRTRNVIWLSNELDRLGEAFRVKKPNGKSFIIAQERNQPFDHVAVVLCGD
jgi:hypothetical protein